MLQKLRKLWSSLPHQVQAGLILFGTAAGTTLAKELQARIFGTLSFSVSSLEHDLGMAFTAGFIAVRTFYCLPNKPAATDSHGTSHGTQE